VIDGLKSSSRKVLYGCFKRNLKGEVKVAQLAGYVSEHASYHHGEESLHGIIVNLAQNFVGSNNLELLSPIGQFGSRHSGGKDAASARYIFTKLANITPFLFPSEDFECLNYREEDGVPAEPEWYVPIIPLVLVNGAHGIGTGFSTSVPKFNPLDLIQVIRKRLQGESASRLTPWYRGFKGLIVEAGVGKYSSIGCISGIKGSSKLEITELPIGKWTQDYKASVLDALLTASKTGISIKGYQEFHTNDQVHFVVSMTKELLEKAKKQGLHKVFRLESSIHSNNMYLFDKNYNLKLYSDVEEILDEYFETRLALYEKRKEILIGNLQKVLNRLENQIRFVRMVQDKIIDLSEHSEESLEEMMHAQGFVKDVQESWNYLTRMPISSLSLSSTNSSIRARDTVRAKLDEISNKTCCQLWLDDLALLEKAIQSL